MIFYARDTEEYLSILSRETSVDDRVLLKAESQSSGGIYMEFCTRQDREAIREVSAAARKSGTAA